MIPADQNLGTYPVPKKTMEIILRKHMKGDALWHTD